MMSRTFRVFVSSTFADWRLEREALRTRVFPRLQSLCRSHGGRFQAIDLRWGISEAAAHDQQTLQICFREIERCRETSPQANFIVLLGDRYGWRPLPDFIPIDEFQSLDGCLGADERALLAGRYRRDDNAVQPVFRLLPRFTNDSDAAWQTLEQQLSDALRRAASGLQFKPPNVRKYVASATEQEIAHRGLLDGMASTAGAFCFFRRIHGLPTNRKTPYRDLDELGRGDADAALRLGALKQELRGRLADRVREYDTTWAGDDIGDNHLHQFCDDVYGQLSEAILADFHESQSVDPTDEEIGLHRSFGDVRRQFFVGRADALEAIDKHLSAPSGVPLVISGPSGSGKTTLMAQAAAAARARHGSDRVVARFVGATPASSDVRALLTTLWREINRRQRTEAAAVPADYSELARGFWEMCRTASEVSPLFLFIDSLNQLSALHDGSNLSWLPAELPERVHVVLSTIPDETLATIHHLVPHAQPYEVEPFAVGDARTLLQRWLHHAGRDLQADQREAVLEAFAASGLPLYLRLAFEEACRWHSDSRAEVLAPTVHGIIRALTGRLAADHSHGPVLLSRSLSYLAAGKHGLGHEEVLDVLSRDDEVMTNFRHRSVQPLADGDPLPTVIWSRLYFDLAPYLVERAVEGVATLDFFHRQFREVIEADYLQESVRRARHVALAGYFARQQLEERQTGERSAPNARKLEEWPYQLARGALWPELDRVLMDFDFVAAKVEEFGVRSLIDDFDLVDAYGGAQVLGDASERLRLVQDALRLATGVLSADARYLAGQLLGRLRRTVEIDGLLAKAAARPGIPWLRPHTASLTAPGGPLLRSLVLNSLVTGLAITTDGASAVLGCDDGTVRLVDLERVSERQRFRIHSSQVSALAIVDADRAASGDATGTVKIWDLHTGAEEARWDAHRQQVTSLVATRHQLLSGSFDGMIRVRNLGDWSEAQLFRPPHRNVRLLAVRQDGCHAILAADEGFGLWSLADGQMIEHSRVNDGEVLSAALTSDGRRAVIASGDLSSACFNLRFWSLDPWKELHCVEGQRWVGSPAGHTGSIAAVDTTPGGEVVLSGSDDRTVRVWDFEADLKSVLRGHDGPVRHVLIEPGGRAALSSSGATLCRWSLEKAQASVAHRHSGSVGGVLHSQHGRLVCSFDRYGGNCLWDLRDLSNIEAVTLDLSGVRPLAFAHRALIGVALPQDRQARGERETLIAWDVSRQQIIAELSMPGRIGSAVVTPDERQLVVTLESGPPRIVDVATLQEVGRIEVPVNGAQHLALADQARLFVSSSADGPIRLWDAASGSEEWWLDNVTGVTDLAVAPDGTRAVSGTNFGRIHVWDLERCCLHFEIIHGDYTQNFSVMAVAITPDGSRIVSGGTDNKIRVWDAESGAPIATFVAEDWTMCAAALGSDLFVAGSQNGAVHVLSLQ